MFSKALKLKNGEEVLFGFKFDDYEAALLDLKDFQKRSKVPVYLVEIPGKASQLYN